MPDYVRVGSSRLSRRPVACRPTRGPTSAQAPGVIDSEDQADHLRSALREYLEVLREFRGVLPFAMDDVADVA